MNIKALFKSEQDHKDGKKQDTFRCLAINNYFQNTSQEEYTITGLCLAMGTSKQVFCDYGEREGYKDIVSHA